MPMQLRLEGPLKNEDELPVLGPEDIGRTWWIDMVWFIWTGAGWQKALATLGRPEDVK